MIPLIRALALAACGVLASPPFIHILQLESYKLRYYLKRSTKPQFLTVFFAVTAVVFVVPFILSVPWPVFLALLLAISGARFYMWKRKPAKKPLVWTARVKRLAASIAVVYGLLGLLPIPFSALTLLVPAFSVGLAALAILPVEEAIKTWYFRDAKRILRERGDLIRIGITGSYGKTSTKFILATILQEKYRVLATRQSFNTPMGLTRVIREQLTDEHEVFIAEMGAKHKGDIATLCGLVQPQYGALTSVGPQHLETFGTVETVAKTKYELIEALPPDGAAFFAGDGGWVDELYKATKSVTSFRTGFEGEPLDVTARGIEVGPDGSAFTLTTAAGQSVECRTRLLGKHNIGNILICAAIALRLGLSLQQVQRGIGKVQPIEHRLQLLPTGNGITVIDDAFNASPNGARAALAVLGDFPGRKIIVTPGLVELGNREAEENKSFGRAMAKVCDEVILVGKSRAALMLPGLEEAGFNSAHIHVVPDIEGATQVIGRVAKPGDCVLFENDLPDNYS